MTESGLRKPFVVVLLALGTLLFASPTKVQAQYARIPLSAYEGQNVSSVVLAGRPDLDSAKFLPLITQHAGEPFAQEKITASIKALQATGQFTEVEPQLVPEANGVRVLFVLHPALYIGIYRFPGATAVFPYPQLLQITNYQMQEPYLADRMQEAQAALTQFFHRSGFFLAEVKAEVQAEPAHGLANLIFHTTLGPRAHFGNITIEGTTEEETAHLHAVLRSLGANLRAASIKPGKNYYLLRLQRATRYLQTQLGKQGHLAAQVKFISAAYDPLTNRADLKFTVQMGPRVRIGVRGTHLWPWTRNRLIPMYSEKSVDRDLVQEGQKNLLSYLQTKGYFDAEVHLQVPRHANSVSIVYQVITGKRHQLASVAVAGNQHYAEKDLLDRVPVKKAKPFRPFSHGKYSQQLLQSSVKVLTDFYRAGGYSDVKVGPEIKTEESGNLSVLFRITEGPQDVVDALNIVGNTTVPVSQLTQSGLRLGPGKPYSGVLVQEDRNHIVANYLRTGYLTATFTARAQTVTNQPHHVIVTYEIYEGPQVFTSAVTTEGREHTRQALINRTAAMSAGVPLSEDDMLSAETRLYNLGIFDWAAVDPRRPITTQTRDEAVIKLHEAKRNRIGYGFGFEIINRGGSLPGGTAAVPGLPPVVLPSNFKTSEKTFYGPRGSFQYTRINMRGRGETYSMGVFAGRLDQRGETTYTVPSFRNSNWQVSTSISAEHNSENPIFTAVLGDAGLQFQRPLGRKKTTNLFLRYDFRRSSLTQLLLAELVPPSDRNVRLSQVSGSLVRDTRDNPIDAHKGFYHSYQLTLAPEALGSNFSFARFQGQTAHYWTIPAGIVWANSLRIGLEEAFAGSHVPVSERFFSGGGSTLRGFPLDSAGPQQTIQACGNPSDPATCALIEVPTGGNQLLILNSEFRIPVPIKKGLQVVGFYDGGNVFPTVGFHGQYTNTLGGGLRYKTPIGPIRIDVGHNLNAPTGIKATQVFVTVGQAF
jgi:outer membrane protein assembly factor BamA